MKPYIYGKRHKVHIINLQETIRGLYQASHFLRNLASTGAQILFLGTKRQLRAVVGHVGVNEREGLPGRELAHDRVPHHRAAEIGSGKLLERAGEARPHGVPPVPQVVE